MISSTLVYVAHASNLGGIVVGATNFPTGPDVFATTTPTLQNTEDSTARVHSERHDDVAAAMMARRQRDANADTMNRCLVTQRW